MGLSLVLLLAPASACPAEPGLFYHLSLDGYSEPEPLVITLDDWGSEFLEGEYQWLLADAALGYRWGSGLEWSFVQRARAHTRINREAARQYGRIERNEPLSADVVPVDLSVSGYSGQGMRLGYRWQTSAFAVGVGVAVFETENLVDGGIRGTLTTDHEGGYHLEANVGYRYNRDTLFNRPDIDRTEGLGWALDVSARWAPHPRWTLRFSGQDLAGAVRWQRAPYTDARANSQRRVYNEEGFVRLNPLFSGTEGYLDDYRQSLVSRYRVESHFQIRAWHLGVFTDYRQSRHYPGLTLGYRMADRWTLALEGSLKQRALAAIVESGPWRLSLGLDTVSWREAHALLFTLGYNVGEL